MLISIINDEEIYTRFQKKWKVQTKNKMLALLLLNYQFSNEKQKDIFNVIDQWGQIYPQTYIWEVKDENVIN